MLQHGIYADKCTDAFVNQSVSSIDIDGITYVHPFAKKANTFVVWNFIDPSMENLKTDWMETSTKFIS
jgi:hypothetical protein